MTPEAVDRIGVAAGEDSMVVDNGTLAREFPGLSTALVTDACLRLGLSIRMAPFGIRPVVAGDLVAGRALPVRHRGSVDVFLEALDQAEPGDVLVIDNGGRTDEGCIGDLTVLEARAFGVRGVVLWGTHRDSLELARLGIPVFSYGARPAGPRRLDPGQPDDLISARFGDGLVTRDDVVLGDADGVVFVPRTRTMELIETARAIATRERAQAELVNQGTTLHQQLRFEEYLERRAAYPSYTFRQHLRRLGGAIEE